MDKNTLIEKLKEAEFFNNHESNRWENAFNNPSDWKLSEETAFFAQLVSLFAADPELPISQLKTFPSTVIIDYLTKSHVIYLNKRLPEIEQHLTQLSSLPGELSETLASVFSWLQKNMEKHFRIEEQSLFPYIEDLYKVKNNQLSVDELKTKYKDFSVNRFIETHHDEVENKLSEIKKYIVRSLSTMEQLFPYRVLLQKLDDLEKDLRLHAQVEDEILVPMALEWEKQH